ncbi:MAG: PTS sugar transporter subunit IIA [Myxococcota bacterium]
MKLTEVLIQDACSLEMKARTKKEVLAELASALAPATTGLDAKGLVDLLLERERLGTTAMGDGIAIPHARVESLGRLVASFGRSRGGVDFESIDGKPTHLFFLLVAPGKEGSQHLLILARLSRLLGKPDFRARLMEVESVEELFEVFEEEEADR